MTRKGLTGKPAARVKPGETRTQMERAIAMCERIASKSSLRAAAQLEGLDSSEFLRMVAKDEELRLLYIASREAALEASVAGMEQEADEVMKTALRKGKAAAAYVSAFSKKVNVLTWQAERLMPKKYGNRLDLNHSGSIDLAGRLNAARARTAKNGDK
jgi:hypothetical protein